MAQTNGVNERARELARERSRRFRERRRQSAGVPPSSPLPAPAPTQAKWGAPAPAVAPAPEQTPPPSSAWSSPSSAPIHGTQPLEGIGDGPEAHADVPPAVDFVEPPPVITQAQEEGAAKFAAIVAFMFKLTLDDAVERFGVGRMVAVAGMSEASAVGLNTDELKAQAVSFVFARAQRCAVKHGFGVSIPYEDEVVTVGASALSVVYLARKFTGRLPEPGARNEARPPDANAAPPSPAADEPESSFNGISVDAAAAGAGDSWLAPGR